jgi:AraC-like DNA-binding protein
MRPAETAPPEPLQAALEQLRLDGAIFFRAEFTESWAYESPPSEIAGLLRPGAERLIFFHIVAAGRCWVELEGGERHWACRGDVIVLPYGDRHRVGGSEPAESVPIVSLIAPPPWETLPVLRYGTGGERTDVVCGYLHSEDRLFDPALRALPPVFVVSPPAGPAAQWVESSIDYALANTSASLPSEPSTRLPELLLVEVLRLHLTTAPAIEHGWIAALHDPVLAPAMAELHAAPERKWTVAELAASAAVSRSLLDERFRQVLGRSPIRYLTEWRMHIADDLLATTHLGVGAIARRVGYDSEEAFSRAFKRSHGQAPSSWRAERQHANPRALTGSP